MKRLYLIFIIIFILSFISGCRTFFPKDGQDNSQPWAQPEDWQRTQGLPGFSGSGSEMDYK